VFEDRVLKRIFGPKREEVLGCWRKVRNEELHNSYFLPNIIRMVKFKRMKWAGHVAHMGEMRNAYTLLVGKPEEKRRDHLEDLGVNGRVIIKWILQRNRV
jgi:hypothetical protein